MRRLQYNKILLQVGFDFVVQLQKFVRLKKNATRKCQASDWRLHKQECKKKDNWEPMHKCGDCAVIQVKVRSEKKAEIKCCPNLDWECQKYRIGKKTRTSHDLLTVILDGKKMTSENFVEILVSR